MNTLSKTTIDQRTSKGVTLIELLVSVALGLIIISGAIGVFISSKQAYKVEDALSRNQEGGRFAMEILAKNIRSAGYAGCSNLEDISPNVIANPPPTHGFAFDTAIIGFEGNAINAKNKSTVWTNPSAIEWIEGTDVLVVAKGGQCGADLTGNMGVTNANIQVANAVSCGFSAGDALLITDCQTADLFRASSVSATTGKITIAHASNTNTTNFLSRAYSEGSTVLRFLQNAYFIGKSPSGAPSLYSVDITGNVQELIENVEDMQIVYGEDESEDGVVDKFTTADNIDQWNSAISVQVMLLIRSGDHITSTPQVVEFNGSQLNNGPGSDYRLRSVFTSTISARNRIP